MTRKCAALKRDGTPCRLQAQPDSDTCWAHDERNAEKRREITSNAGKNRNGREIAQVKKHIRTLVDDVVEGKVDRGRASVAFQGLGVLKGFIELERKAREQDELIARLEALEERIEGDRSRAPARRGGAWW